MTPFKTLPPETQAKLREAYAKDMETQVKTCSLDDKIARFNAWLAPQGVSFDLNDLPRRK
ncbi:hypothetical protein [Celeribacter baekdonensis]|jgi:hypothetical protein|uniref:hypothetical protein n=1 Tax=Celeribacter baekdonensis TaxID=875171 RepID=UPI003A93D575